MMAPRLTDGVVVLDGHTPADVAAHLAGEDDEQARRFGWRSTEESVTTAIERWREEWATEGSTRAFAVREHATGALIGGCEIRLETGGVAAMSYWIVPSHRGRGHATRAVRLASDYAFTALSATTIELHVDRDNAASRGVARSAGFVQALGPARHESLGRHEGLYRKLAPTTTIR